MSVTPLTHPTAMTTDKHSIKHKDKKDSAKKTRIAAPPATKVVKQGKQHDPLAGASVTLQNPQINQGHRDVP